MGNIMCTCKEDYLEKVKEKLSERLTQQSRETLETKWDGEEIGITADNKIATRQSINLSYSYQSYKVNGEPYKNITKNQLMIITTHCPFCGEALEVS